MRRLPAAAALLLLLATGCSLPPYARSRLADLGDAIPISVALGWGISADFQATPLLHVGLGLTPVVSRRVGYEDRTFHGRWNEFVACFPWSFWLTDVSSVPPRPRGADIGAWYGPLPLVYRWEVRRDAPWGEGELPVAWEPQLREWGRYPPLSRETTGALLIPEDRRELNWHDLHLAQGDPEPLSSVGSPTHATLWEVSRDGRELPPAWDLFQADIFLGFVGVRVGFRPWEALDFLTGFFGLDIADDDYSTPDAATPHPAPEPPAPPPADTAAPPAAPPAGAPPAPATPDQPPATPPDQPPATPPHA